MEINLSLNNGGNNRFFFSDHLTETSRVLDNETIPQHLLGYYDKQSFNEYT